MKLVVYSGGCKSITKNGIKFSDGLRTALVEDETGKLFEGMDGFAVHPVEREDVDKTVDPTAELKKRLNKMRVEELREMCGVKGLEAEGTKDVLIERIINAPKE